MFFFVHESTGEKVHILAGKNYTVGVSSTDFPLKLNDKVDKSISRKHAMIQVNFSKKEATLSYKRETLPSIKVTCTDSSTYGTFLNDNIQSSKKVDKGSIVSLERGDRVRFGLQWNTFSLIHEETVILAVDDEVKEAITDLAWQLCAFVQRNWNYDILPTYFCSERLFICPELLCCLCKNIKLVTPRFWRDCLNAVLAKKALPSPEDYIPPIAEHEINLKYVERRSRLFSRKKFVFTNTTMYFNWKDVVECAGGISSKWRCCTESVESIARSDDYIVIGGLQDYEMDDETERENKKNVAKLKKLSDLYGSKKRFIPLKEIGLAILKCETEEFCNPNFKEADILVPDSIPSEPGVEVKQEVVLETVETDYELEEEEEDSFISFRDQSVLKRLARSPAAAEDSLRAKVPRMESREREPSPCSSNYVPDHFTSTRTCVDATQGSTSARESTSRSRNVASTSAGDTPQVAATAKPASRKRQRVESSSDEDPFPNSKDDGDEDDEDIFGFANTSFSKKTKKVRTIKVNTHRAVPDVRESIELPEDDDYNLEDKWTETSIVKREPSDELDEGVSRISIVSNSFISGTLVSQKTFRKTAHSCMTRLPEIISLRDMKKVTLSGKVK